MSEQAHGPTPVSGLHEVEKLLDGAAENITHLRPGFFFENYFWQLESIRDAGSIFMPLSGGTRVPMVATADIARVAADRLMDGSWTGRSVLGIHGPADLSLDEAARALSEALGRQVTHVRVEESQAREAMLSSGLSEGNAEIMLEMYRGMESGHMSSKEPRTPQSTTPTTLDRFGREVLGQMLGAGASH